MQFTGLLKYLVINYINYRTIKKIKINNKHILIPNLSVLCYWTLDLMLSYYSIIL